MTVSTLRPCIKIISIVNLKNNKAIMIPLRICLNATNIWFDWYNLFFVLNDFCVVKQLGEMFKMVDSYYQLLIVSYLIGSISSAIIISKALGLPDPRTQGSKNPGATNVLRLGGKKIAAFVLFFDGLKGAVPVFIGVYYGFGLTALTLTALCAFLGHVFPVF